MRKFHLTDGSGGRYYGVCRGCRKETSGLTHRLRRHADNCAALHSQDLWQPSKCQQRTPASMVCNKAQQQAFQQELARVVFSGNLAFMSVRDPQMVKFHNHFACKLKIPSPRINGGRLLDEEHARQVAHLSHLPTSPCQLISRIPTI